MTFNIKKNIIIGTAQLGSNYGINNKSEKIVIKEKTDFLNYAYKNNYKYFDTAFSYKNSQIIIGSWIKANKVKPKISSKIPNLSKYKNMNMDINKIFNDCLHQLQLKRIENLFLHNYKDWQNKNIKKSIENIVNKKLVSNFGFSIYEINEIPNDPYVKILQIPGNIFNQDILLSDELNLYKEKGGKIHIRSIFIQGLLLMNPKTIPKKLEDAKKGITYFQNIANEINVDVTHLAILCIKYLLPKSNIIIGLDNTKQLKNIMKINDCYITSADLKEVLKKGRKFSNKIWDPRYW